MKNFLYFLLLGALLIGFSSCPDDDELIPMEEEEINPPVVDLMPDIAFSAGPYYVGCAISLTATSMPGATLQINGSDGSNRTGAAHTLVFDRPGSYTYTVVATLNGRSEEQDRTITVVEQSTFLELYQENGDFTRMHKLLPLPGGGFATYGDYCDGIAINGNCARQGFLLHWFNADGTLRTTRSFGNPIWNYIPRALAVASDGNLVVVFEHGVTSDNDAVEIRLMKIGETGSRLWLGAWEASWDLHPRSLIEKSDGSFVVGGYWKRPSDNINRSVMLYFSSTGEYQRSQTFGELNAASRIERLLQVGPNEILGLMTFDGQMKIANSLSNSVADINALSYNAGGLVALPNGASAAVTTDGSRIRVTRRLASGELASNRALTAPGVHLDDVIFLDNGNLLVAGKKRDGGVDHGYLAEITLRAELVWEKQLDEAYARLRGVSETQDCGIFTVGYTNRPAANNGNNEGYYLKLKAEGEL